MSSRPIYPSYNPSYGWIPKTGTIAATSVSKATVHNPRKGWAQVRGGNLPNSWSPNTKQSPRNKMKTTAVRWAVVAFKGKRRYYGSI